MNLEHMLHLPPGNERKVVLIAAVVGILGFMLYVASRKRAATASTLSLPGATSSGGGGGGSGGPSSNEVRLKELDVLGSRQFEFEFGGDFTSAFTAQGSRGQSRGGGSTGLNLGFGSGSFGFGSSEGSSSNSRTGAFQNVNRDITTLRLAGVGYATSEIENFLRSIVGLSGTYEQHSQQQLRHNAANTQITEEYLGAQVLSSDAGRWFNENILLPRVSGSPGTLREPRVLGHPASANDILVRSDIRPQRPTRYRPGSDEWLRQRYPNRYPTSMDRAA